MGGTGRQVLDRPARLTPGDRPAPPSRDRPAQAPSRLRFRTRLDQTATIAALVAVTAMLAAVAAAKSSGAGQAPARQPAPAAVVTANAVPAITRPGHGSVPHPVSPTAAPVPRAAAPLALTAADHQDCPAAATACVDLTRHITWLQAGRRVTYGPIQMEPGKPASQHQTPRGTFQVAWKAGPSYQSNTYHEPMPWATFFAVGGIAFHGGSLTAWSHGCVHMTDTNAHYYNEHLPIGAEVVVF